MTAKKIVATVSRKEVDEKTFVRLDHPPFDILVVKTGDRYYAIEDACNHAGASLAEGYLQDACIICPMHGYVFSLESGELLAPKGLCDAQRTYGVEIDGDEIRVVDTFNLVILPL